MITFVAALAILIGGYFLYGRFTERIFRPDGRTTPALAQRDGVDYVPMKTWRVFLVQLLNIAGTGPIFGALMGAVSCTYILMASEGFGLSQQVAYPAGAVFALLCACLFGFKIYRQTYKKTEVHS